MSDQPADRPSNDDQYFEELTKAVFQGGLGWPAIEAKWSGVRRAFSNFSVRDVSDYLPDDVDRLMSDPQSVRSLQKIEATIENAAEVLLIAIEHGSFREYLDSFPTPGAAAADVASRFRQVGDKAAADFVQRVTGQPVAG